MAGLKPDNEGRITQLTAGGREEGVLEMELLERESLGKGIPKEELTKGLLAVGGNDINVAN